MPQWRKLHVKAAESLDINDMPDDFTRLLWVMLPLGLDSEGRGIDNPSWIKSKVMPLRTDVTMERVEVAMCWYADRGMIHRYEVDGRYYFYVPTFGQYQGNTSREAPSSYPPPPDDTTHDLLTTYSRPTHDQGTQGSSTDSDSDSESPTGQTAAPAEKPKPKTPRQAEARTMFTVLAEICQIDWRVCNKEQRGALNQTEKMLREKVRASPDDLSQFREWWYGYDWRGKKGEAPAPGQVRETWGKFAEWRNGSKPKEPQGEPVTPGFLEA